MYMIKIMFTVLPFSNFTLDLLPSSYRFPLSFTLYMYMLLEITRKRYNLYIIIE